MRAAGSPIRVASQPIAASCLVSGYKVIQRFIEIECTQNLTTPGDLSFPETGFIAL